MKNQARRTLGLALLALLAGVHGAVAATPVDSPAVTPRARAWQAVGPTPSAIQAQVAAHAPSNTVYMGSLGGGVHKSSDGGSTFADVNGDPSNGGLPAASASALVMAADDPSTVYVGVRGLGIWKTVDGGARWAPTADTTSNVLFLAIDPTDSNKVYAGLQNAQPFRRTVNGGATWVTSVLPTSPNAVWAIAVDAVNPAKLYAGTSGFGAFKSVDAGASWSAMTVDAAVWSLVIDPADSNIVYAGSNGNGVYKSTNAGASWTRQGSPSVGVVFALARVGSALYAGTAAAGVEVSNDDGATWQPSGLAKGHVLSLSADAAGAVYAGTSLQGAQKTTDGGEDWTRLAWNLLKDCNCQDGHALALDPSQHDRVLFTTNDGGLIETKNGGRNWRDGGRHGFVARSPRSVAFDPRDAHRVYAGSFTGGGFFKSEDGGRSWHRRWFPGVPESLHTTGVAVDPVDQSVYVATMGGTGVWKSADFGETFARVDRAVAEGPFLNFNGRGITVDPNVHTTVYFAGSTGIWRSLDGGATWARVHSQPSFSVTVDPADSTIVYGGTQAFGVVKSTNGGTSFAASSAGMTDLRMARTGGVVVNPADRQVVYAATEGGGVFKSGDGGVSWRAAVSGLDSLDVRGIVLDPVDPDVLYVSTPSSVFKTVSGGE